jgi:hypothetical protein
MRFRVRVESEPGFSAWLADAHKQGDALSDTALTDLMRPKRAGGELTYSSVEHDPFESIANGRLATHWSINEAL